MYRFLLPGIFCLTSGFPASCPAQNKSADGACHFSLSTVDGQLSGPGASEFLSECRKASYVLFGEQHGIRGVAQFVAATQKSLAGDGFNSLIRESGDWFAAQMSLHPPL